MRRTGDKLDGKGNEVESVCRMVAPVPGQNSSALANEQGTEGK